MNWSQLSGITKPWCTVAGLEASGAIGHGSSLFFGCFMSTMFFCSYAKVYESACTPSYPGQKRELTSEEVNAELARWKPKHDYGTDSVFSITPPVVSPQDMAIYEKSCRVAEKGPIFQTHEYRVYSKYIAKWSPNT